MKILEILGDIIAASFWLMILFLHITVPLIIFGLMFAIPVAAVLLVLKLFGII